MMHAFSMVPATPSPPRDVNSVSFVVKSKPESPKTQRFDSSFRGEPAVFEQPNNNFGHDISADIIDAATAEARRVILQEARGLDQQADMISESFCRAASILLSVPGRIIVTGLGKSGHIGRKIASTLASTGSPAFFLHPGDFNHGELGAINRGDALLMLSRSGDVPELLQTILRCHRLEIPLIAMTARSQSKLAKDSNVTLLIPDIPEACPHGLAPTTSSTCMLALGDALAMYMMKRRRFTGDEFRINHPGGNIGRRALTIRELLIKHDGTTAAPVVFKTTRFTESVTVMLCGSLGMAGIVDEEAKLIDVLTDTEVGTAMAQKLNFCDATVFQVLNELKTREPSRFLLTIDEFTVTETCQVSLAVTKMNRRQLPGIFVINESGYSIGFITLNFCLEAGITPSC